MPTTRAPTAGRAPGAGEEGRTTSDRPPSFAGYAAAGLALAALGWGLAAWSGMPAVETGAGAAGGWAVQTAAFRPLWTKIRGGERALHVWVAGMVARVAGLGVVAGGAALAGLEVVPAAVAYGAAVIVLLWAEGWWLHRASRAAEDDGGVEHGGRAPDG